MLASQVCILAGACSAAVGGTGVRDKIVGVSVDHRALYTTCGHAGLVCVQVPLTSLAFASSMFLSAGLGPTSA